MKTGWMKAAEVVCGRTKGAPRHRDTWWWCDEVDKAVEEKRRQFAIWRRTREATDKEEYLKAKKIARKIIWLAQERKRKELVENLRRQEEMLWNCKEDEK